MTESVRKPNPDETDPVRAMWVECFPDGGPRFVDWYFSEVYRPEWTLGIFSGGELLSNLQMIPYTLSVRGRAIQADTLTGVATGAAYRNRGLAKTVMAEALKDMAARGRGFTFLYPFNHQFYQHLGWETCSMALHCEKPAEELPASMPDGWEARAAQPDAAVLAGIYGRFMAGYNCRSIRDAAAWRKRIAENAANDGFMLLASFRGEPAAYAFCEEHEPEVNMDEMACDRTEGMLALLAALHPRGKSVSWAEPQGARSHLLPGCWFNRVKLQPHVMFRVVDVAEAFRQAAPACAGELAVRVHGDAMRPENDGVWHVRAVDGFAEAAREDAHSEFTCGVGTLARILTGFMDAREAVEAGLAAGDGEAVELLARMYPRMRNFLFELY